MTNKPNSEALRAAAQAVVEKGAVAAGGLPDDFLSHKLSWRNALTHCAKSAVTEDDKSYWTHELRAFDRAYAELTAAPQPPKSAGAVQAGGVTAVLAPAAPRQTIDVLCGDCKGTGISSPPLTDAEVIRVAQSAGFKYLAPDDDPDGFPGGFDLEHGLDAMRKLITGAAAYQPPKSAPVTTADVEAAMLAAAPKPPAAAQEPVRPWAYAWAYARRMKGCGWGFCSKREYEEAKQDGDEVAKLYTYPSPQLAVPTGGVPGATEPLYITHGPLMRHAAELLRMRKPVLPGFESVAAELDRAVDGHPTPSDEPSLGWLEVARIPATPQPSAVQEPVKWWNGCDKTVPAALRYLADHERPCGGEARFNSMHLFQLAAEIERMAKAPLYAHPTPQPAASPEPVTGDPNKAVVWLSSRQLLGVTAESGLHLPFRRQHEGLFDTPVFLANRSMK